MVYATTSEKQGASIAKLVTEYWGLPKLHPKNDEYFLLYFSYIFSNISSMILLTSVHENVHETTTFSILTQVKIYILETITGNLLCTDFLLPFFKLNIMRY